MQAPTTSSSSFPKSDIAVLKANKVSTTLTAYTNAHQELSKILEQLSRPLQQNS